MKKYRKRKRETKDGRQHHYVYSTEIATQGKRIVQGTNMFIAIEEFKTSLRAGDVFRFSPAVLSMQYDGTLRPLKYVVKEIHPNVAYLEHVTEGGVIRGESMDYFKLLRCGRRCTDAKV